MELLILAIVTIVMMAIGVPIGISIAAGLISTALLFDTTTLTFIAQQLYTGLDSFALLAVPGFMLAGQCGGKVRGTPDGRLLRCHRGGVPVFRRDLRFFPRNRGGHRRYHDPLYGA